MSFRIPGNKGPLVRAGLLMGAGLGGFVDGIVFHQIAQAHAMLSARLPPRTLATAMFNMFWDGIFHAGVWVLTVIGLLLLFRAGRRADVPWSGRTLLGALLAGWGSFNVVEGVLNHHLLRLHHVIESAANHLPADLGFLGFGLALIGAGTWLIRGAPDTAARGGEALRV